MPGSTSIAGAGDDDGATGGGEKLTTPESGADIAAEPIASSFDALESARTIAFTAPRSAAESGVPRLTAGELSG